MPVLLLRQLLERQRDGGRQLRPPAEEHPPARARLGLRLITRELQRPRAARAAAAGDVGGVPTRSVQRRARARRRIAGARVRRGGDDREHGRQQAARGVREGHYKPRARGGGGAAAGREEGAGVDDGELDGRAERGGGGVGDEGGGAAEGVYQGRDGDGRRREQESAVEGGFLLNFLIFEGGGGIEE